MTLLSLPSAPDKPITRLIARNRHNMIPEQHRLEDNMIPIKFTTAYPRMGCLMLLAAEDAQLGLLSLQVLLLRLRQACVHPYLAQTKDDGSGTLPSDDQEPAEGAEGGSGMLFAGLSCFQQPVCQKAYLHTCI